MKKYHGELEIGYGPRIREKEIQEKYGVQPISRAESGALIALDTPEDSSALMPGLETPGFPFKAFVIEGGEIYELVLSKGAQAVFEKMAEAALEKGYPEGFATDLLVHDRVSLYNAGRTSTGQEFIWMLRKNGTQLVGVTAADLIAHWCARGLRRGLHEQSANYYFYHANVERGVLEAVSAEEALDVALEAADELEFRGMDVEYVEMNTEYNPAYVEMNIEYNPADEPRAVYVFDRGGFGMAYYTLREVYSRLWN